VSQKTAVIYARVSDVKRGEEKVSIPSQIARGRQLAKELGARVLQVYPDEGRSAWHGDRPAFDEALDICELKRVTYFITWSTSRFSRNRVRASYEKERLDRCGTQIRYVASHIDRSTDDGWMLDAMFEIIDERYSRQVSQDTRRSMIQNAQDGYHNGGGTPFGFMAVPVADGSKKTRLAPNPDEAWLVKEIFEMRAGGAGAKTISQTLNEQGKLFRGHRWVPGAIGRLLRNRKVIGETVFGRKDRRTNRIRAPEEWVVVASHEAIIERGLWDFVQALVDDSAENAAKGTSRVRHLFVGLLTCGQCGAPMHVESAKGRSRRYRYYHCSAAQAGEAHRPRRIDAGALDSFLVDFIGRRLFSTENLLDVVQTLKTASQEWHRERERRRLELCRQRSQVREQRDRLFQILENNDIGDINLRELGPRLRERREELEQLGEQLEALDAEPEPQTSVTDDDVRQLREFLLGVISDPEQVVAARAFLNRIIESIEVGARTVRVTYRPEHLVAASERFPPDTPRPPGWLPGTSLLGTMSIEALLPERLRLAA
jgi:DNA invertase Pin-like site-specific DNA recombinase